MLKTGSRIIRGMRSGERFVFLLSLLSLLASYAVYPLLAYSISEGSNSVSTLILLALYFSLPSFSTQLDTLLQSIGNGRRMEYIKQSFSASLRMDYEYLESEEGQSLFSKAVSCTNSSQAPFAVILREMVAFVSSLIFILIVLFSLISRGGLLVSVLSLAAVAVSFISAILISKDRLKLKGSEVVVIRDVNYLTKITRMPSSAETLAYYKAGVLIDEKFSEQQKRYKRSAGAFIRSSLLVSIAEFAFIFMLLFLVFRGESVSSLLLFPILWQLVKASLTASARFSEIKADTSRIDDFFAFCDKGKETAVAETASSDIDEVRFEHVTFAYPSAPEKVILKDIDLTIKKGERVGVLGVNGAGKTTLAKLLMGFYHPLSGTVSINGSDISSLENLNSYISCVFQDDTVVPATIRENILMGRSFDSERYEKALIESGLRKILEEKCIDDIREIPAYYCPGGVDFSGGEMVHLYLARCLYKDAPFVIMDEPSAALDPIQEADFFERLSSLIDGKSGLFITHRATSLKAFDRIIVISGGTVAEEGTHEELIKRGGVYAEMFRTQSEFFSR